MATDHPGAGGRLSTMKGALMGLSSRLMTTGLMVATTLMLAIRLGPAGTGVYFLFLRVVALLAVLADLGFSQSANIFAGHGESPRRIHLLMIRFSAGSSLILLLLFEGLWKLVGPKILPNYPLYLQAATMVALPFFVYSVLWRNLMIGLAKIRSLNLVQIGSAISTFLLMAILVFGLSMGLKTAVVIYTCVLIVQAAVMAIIAASIRTESSVSRAGLFREMFRFGLRGTGGAIATVVWQRIPIFILNVYHGEAVVGTFAVAQQLTEKMLLPMEAMQDAIYRRMARLSLADAKAVMNRYVRISGWSMILFLLAATIALLLSIGVFLGPAYRNAMPVVIALIPGAVMMSTALLLSTFFVAHLRRPGLMSLMGSVTLGVVLLLSAALIPQYGAVGAALAIAGAQITGTIIVAILYLRITGSPLLALLKIDGDDRTLFRSQIRRLFYEERSEK